jgi:hypothetical protein
MVEDILLKKKTYLLPSAWLSIILPGLIDGIQPPSTKVVSANNNNLSHYIRNRWMQTSMRYKYFNTQYI